MQSILWMSTLLNSIQVTFILWLLMVSGRKGFCQRKGVLSQGCFVAGGFCRRGFCRRGFCRGGFVCTPNVRTKFETQLYPLLRPGVAKKFGAVPGHVPISIQKSYMPGLYSSIHLYVHSFSSDFRLEFRVGVANPQIAQSREGVIVRGRGWYRSKERW